MGWQDYIVWAIGIAVAAIVVKRIWCLFRGKRRGGCASCGSTQCPLKAVHPSRKKADNKK